MRGAARNLSFLACNRNVLARRINDSSISAGIAFPCYMKKLQTTTDRSKTLLLPGAMAITVTTGGVQAATVQITLENNFYSTSGGSQLDGDLTGDGIADFAWNVGSVFTSMTQGVRLNVNPGSPGSGWVGALCFFSSSFVADAGLDGAEGIASGFEPQSTIYLNPISFSDERINGGELTEGFLETFAYNSSISDHGVEFTRLIFDDASTTRPEFEGIPEAQNEWTAIPEPSSLAMLALGAAGLSMRRRKAQAV